MNIQLPERFYYSKDWKQTAYVEDEILYVQGDVNYENLMYSLAYSIYGYNNCVYCGRKLTKETRTLDHVWPRRWGGLSIPDNLVPSCSNCNSKKNSMTLEQYNEWCKLDESLRAEAQVKFCMENEEKMRNNYLLPEEWLTSFDVAEVIDDIDFELIENFGNDKIDLYYDTYGKYPRPIIVSSNNWVFKGKHILYHAKVNCIKTVSCVRLDNVVRVK